MYIELHVHIARTCTITRIYAHSNIITQGMCSIELLDYSFSVVDNYFVCFEKLDFHYYDTSNMIDLDNMIDNR